MICEHLEKISSVSTHSKELVTFVCRMRRSLWLTTGNTSDSHGPYAKATLVGTIKLSMQANGSSSGFASVHDLSVRQNVFVALAQPLAELNVPRFLVASEPVDFFYRLTTQAKFIVVEEEFANILGYSVEDLIGRSLYEICHTEELAIIANSHRHLLHPSLESEPDVVERHRFLTRSNNIILARTMWQASRNPMSGFIEAILVRSTIIDERHVSGDTVPRFPVSRPPRCTEPIPQFRTELSTQHAVTEIPPDILQRPQHWHIRSSRLTRLSTSPTA
ncbi:hypothetical protein RvY_10701 [Ramazzottius varieornatus]|uniref:PAS domain-containing protein n=1 Tax=Ramazzottius varieornatus TaxID=947166 RepID=A0A1D1VJ11_RAMVA|nr:hypothetical protein RvY_10701 [Ramazzottius varieornatus]